MGRIPVHSGHAGMLIHASTLYEMLAYICLIHDGTLYEMLVYMYDITNVFPHFSAPSPHATGRGQSDSTQWLDSTQWHLKRLVQIACGKTGKTTS